MATMLAPDLQTSAPTISLTHGARGRAWMHPRGVSIGSSALARPATLLATLVANINSPSSARPCTSFGLQELAAVPATATASTTHVPRRAGLTGAYATE